MSSRIHFSADAKQISNFTAALQPHSWPMTGAEQPQVTCSFELVLLAIAGHDLRQLLQIAQSAHDLLGPGLRSRSELTHLRSSQRAIDQLNGTALPAADRFANAITREEHQAEARQNWAAGVV